MGILGMATKYSETYIAVKYRVRDVKGKMCGGQIFLEDSDLGGLKVRVVLPL